MNYSEPNYRYNLCVFVTMATTIEIMKGKDIIIGTNSKPSGMQLGMSLSLIEHFEQSYSHHAMQLNVFQIC
jgi:hypothetical protein